MADLIAALVVAVFLVKQQRVGAAFRNTDAVIVAVYRGEVADEEKILFLCFIAAVVRADETGVVKTLVGSDGTKNDVLYCQARSLENCLTGGKPELGFMQMDGQEVFKFAVKKVPEIVNAILEETGTDREAVQHYLLHQANIRILEAASRRLKVPMDKIPVNIERYGNTSAASIPILLDEMHRDGRLKRGDTLVMAGFGAGLTWGAALMTW